MFGDNLGNIWLKLTLPTMNIYQDMDITDPDQNGKIVVVNDTSTKPETFQPGNGQEPENEQPVNTNRQNEQESEKERESEKEQESLNGQPENEQEPGNEQEHENGEPENEPENKGQQTDVVKKKKKNRDLNVQYCSAINCNNNRFVKKELSFFRFPRDEERCKRWVINTRREDLRKKTAQQLFNGNVLCADHFEDSQFTSARRNRLKPGKGIPTLFDVPNPPPRISPTERREIIRVKVKKTKQKPKPQKKRKDQSELDREKIATLKRVIKAQRRRLERLYESMNNAKVSNSPKREIEFIKTLAGKYLNEDSNYFFGRQLDMSLNEERGKLGKRWDLRDKNFALSIYDSSPKTYSLLQKYFYLPSPVTLERLRNDYIR